MKNLFSKLYDLTIGWSRHHHAPYYLAGVAFAESSFFPIPPDVMLVSMGLARPDRAWRNAFICSLFSVLGGMFGYLIGLLGFELVRPLLAQWGWLPAYQQVVQWFAEYDFWIIFLAGFSPIPYKLFTIAAGALRMSFLPFVLASIIARSLRFYLVSAILYFYGERLHHGLRYYIDWIGWLTVLAFVIVYIVMKWIL